MPPSGTGLHFSGGKVPVHYSVDWGRDWRESGTEGVAKSYTVTQQGFTANVTCQAMNRSENSFSITPTVTQAQTIQGSPPSNYTFLTWVAAVNCSGSEYFVMNSSAISPASDLNSMTYFTLGNATGQLDPGSLGFLPTVVCPSPQSKSFNPDKFGIALSVSSVSCD